MHLQRTFLTCSLAIWINDTIAKANHYQYCKNKSIKIYHARCYFHPSFEQSINKSINNAVNKEIIKHCSLALTFAGNYIHNRSSRNLRWCSPNCIPRWGGFVTLLKFVSLAFGLLTNTQYLINDNNYLLFLRGFSGIG